MSNQVTELMQEGLAAFAGGDTTAARRCFEKLLVVDPGNVQALRYVENIKQQEQYAKSDPVLAAAATRNSSSAAVSVPVARATPAPLAPLAPPMAPPAPVVPGAAPAGVQKEASAVGLLPLAVSPPAAMVDPWGSPDDQGVTMLSGEGVGVLASFVQPARDVSGGDGVDLSDNEHPDIADEQPADAGESDGELVHLFQGGRELFELNDFSGALQLFEKILVRNPDHADALRLANECRQTLITMLESKLGDLKAVPTVMLAYEDIIWLNIDHRAGFVLARIDGISSFEEIVDLSGMERLATYRILLQLLEAGAIAIN